MISVKCAVKHPQWPKFVSVTLPGAAEVAMDIGALDDVGIDGLVDAFRDHCKRRQATIAAGPGHRPYEIPIGPHKAI